MIPSLTTLPVRPRPKRSPRLSGELDPMQKDYERMRTDGAALCASQFSQDKSAYFSVDDGKKSELNKIGFSCASGERTIADTIKNDLLSCGMQVGKVQGSLAFRSGPMGASGAVATACSAATASMMAPAPQPSEKVACINEKNQVVASSVVHAHALWSVSLEKLALLAR